MVEAVDLHILVPLFGKLCTVVFDNDICHSTFFVVIFEMMASIFTHGSSLNEEGMALDMARQRQVEGSECKLVNPIAQGSSEFCFYQKG